MHKSKLTGRHPCQLLAILTSFAVLAGCGGPHVHKKERFELDSQYRKEYSVAPEFSCQSAKRALLSQGYTVDNDNPLRIEAHKAFDPDDEVMTVLEFSVTCLDHSSGSVVFANAEESVYKLRKTQGNIGVGVSSVGSIKLPWGKQLDSLVKTSGKTINDKKFYKRFFKLVRNIVKSTRWH